MIDEKKLLDELIRKDQSLQKHLKHAEDDGNELFNFGLKSQLAMLKSIISCISKQPGSSAERRQTMNKDIEEFLTEKKNLYQRKFIRLEKQERNAHELLECEPGREDVIEDLNTVIKLQDRYNALIDFITELQESYF